MEENMKKFPDNFPKDCPPKEAIEEQIEVYRLSNNDPPKESDFLSHVLLYPKKKYNTRKAYGISVFSEYEDVEHLLAVNALMRKKFTHICRGITQEGVIQKAIGSSHITWWLYVGATPQDYFETIK